MRSLVTSITNLLDNQMSKNIIYFMKSSVTWLFDKINETIGWRNALLWYHFSITCIYFRQKWQNVFSLITNWSKSVYSGTTIAKKFRPPYVCIFWDKFDRDLSKRQKLQLFVWFTYIDDVRNRTGNWELHEKTFRMILMKKR